MSTALNLQTSINPTVQEWFDSRKDLRTAFLAKHKLAGISLAPVGEDCAFRRYFRLKDKDHSLILMESMTADSAMATPGHNLSDFIRIGSWLRGQGLHTPEIYEVDEKQGYVLMEDFGDLSFRKAMDGTVKREQLYDLGADVLIALSKVDASGLRLPNYYDSHVHKGRRRVVDWYMPAVTGRANGDGLAEDYLTVWDSIEKKLPSCPQGFLHIDYHLENLMWLADRQGLQRCGLLDFQGAMTGPVPYDLLNLLEDARMDIPDSIRKSALERFCKGMTADEKKSFLSWYRVLATQFHCRVIGQFVRLAVRDGKTRYLQHLPRLADYIRRGLEDPLLAPLAQWFGEQNMSFEKSPAIDPAALRRLIRSDAF